MLLFNPKRNLRRYKCSFIYRPWFKRPAYDFYVRFYALPLFAIVKDKQQKLWLNLIYWGCFILNIVAGIVTKTKPSLSF